MDLVDLIYDAFIDLCPTELEGGRQIDPTRYVDKEDVRKWLSKNWKWVEAPTHAGMWWMTYQVGDTYKRPYVRIIYDWGLEYWQGKPFEGVYFYEAFIPEVPQSPQG
jgi:hypothetical protein